MIEVIVVAYMFSFVASTGVRAVVMSQFICIASSPRPHGGLPAKNNYWFILTYSPNISAKATEENIYATTIASITLYHCWYAMQRCLGSQSLGSEIALHDQM